MNNLLSHTDKPIIWSISGADCSGGAGIAADIKTAHVLGCELCHLVTANTVQNSQQLVAVNATDVTILQQQEQILITDKPPQVIKIGLIANAEQLDWLVNLLVMLKSKKPEIMVVYDPVGQASVGGGLSSLSPAQLAALLPCIDLLTPNLEEAQQLTESVSEDMTELSRRLTQLGVKQVIIKGGHGGGETSVDYAYSANEQRAYQLVSPRIVTDYSHGGGCTFASALASFLAHHYLLRDAFTLAKAFIQQGLKQHQGKLGYYGAFEQTQWPGKLADFPRVITEISDQSPPLPAFNSLSIERDNHQGLGLYPVVDSVEWLARLMPLGINIIQLRLKGLSEQALRDEISRAVELSQQYDCQLFINDYWQLAIEYGAYGVHIGQEDLIDADLHAIAQAGLRLGVSTHGCYEFLLAQQLKPSYLAIGAIFPTTTKDMTGQIQGLNNLRQILQLATDIPVVAIGGINLERAPAVWQTGVDSLAVVTAITHAENPEQATRDLQRICSGKKDLYQFDSVKASCS
ncbi:bifunctional hydroxymethylpyrimidine kinase/phosphomethylpyrimidine kinase [Thalassotalea insulae]|uniref:Thiamine-phosphate synthase n=1 Tax=Thalassotalea insulae TaxID=2056778 RepID=A0ABQ6GUF6_9GAMM|nr:thiamine phosphate synthase [Thalassotalea insulae]GLX78305.1 bifunctional hydroxymethylpyrimidine kinase/phosphomethylpyrimidine kinase [Thalassotalea insulae]